MVAPSTNQEAEAGLNPPRNPLEGFSLDAKALSGAVGLTITAITTEKGYPCLLLSDGTRIVATSLEEVWLERYGARRG